VTTFATTILTPAASYLADCVPYNHMLIVRDNEPFFAFGLWLALIPWTLAYEL
jgi:hypothetical protein